MAFSLTHCPFSMPKLLYKNIFPHIEEETDKALLLSLTKRILSLCPSHITLCVRCAGAKGYIHTQVSFFLSLFSLQSEKEKKKNLLSLSPHHPNTFLPAPPPIHNPIITPTSQPFFFVFFFPSRCLLISTHIRWRRFLLRFVFDFEGKRGNLEKEKQNR